LSRLIARDVMVPFTLQWDSSDSPTAMARAIDHSGVTYVPCLDEEGLYLGVLNRQALASLLPEGASSETLEDLDFASIVERIESPLTIREPYAELMDHFTADDQQVVVVLRDERPLGYVTHAALASLLETVDDQTFQGGGSIGSGSGTLIVSDLVEESGCAEAVHA